MLTALTVAAEVDTCLVQWAVNIDISSPPLARKTLIPLLGESVLAKVVLVFL